MAAEVSSKQELKISIYVEHAKCSICLNIWHDIVTAAPCYHNFCNGCFSEWLRRSQAKHSAVLCPQCRAVVHFIGRNHFLRNIEKDILQADPLLKRSDEEIAQLDSFAYIKSNLAIKTGKNKSRKRSRLNDEDDEGSSSTVFPCPQCGTEYGGFHCSQDTSHIECHACGGMMPSRTEISFPQHCIGCDRAFCGAYWHAQGVGRSNFYPICRPETLLTISERTVSRIPTLAHEKNRHEQDLTEKCIRHMGKTLQDVISDFLVKFDNREIDRTTLPLNHAEVITSRTHICNECYEKLVSFLLYWFRVCLPKYHLPPEASNREDCWYGFACRTQHHNEDHARKRNHVCHPTRNTRT